MSIRQFSKGSGALLAAVVLIGCGDVSKPPAPLASSAPTVSMVVPQTNGVGTNRQVAVVFSKPMDPASINNSSFVVAGATGTVTYDAANKIAAFKPLADFTTNTLYNASITTCRALRFLFYHPHNHRHFSPDHCRYQCCSGRQLRAAGPEDHGHF
jgi:hypothetical protein